MEPKRYLKTMLEDEGIKSNEKLWGFLNLMYCGIPNGVILEDEQGTLFIATVQDFEAGYFDRILFDRHKSGERAMQIANWANIAYLVNNT